MGRSSARERLAALASPVRIEIIGAVQNHGPCAIRELAGHLARPADGLYHHVRLLLRAGILAEKERRRVGRREEAVYALTAPRIAGDFDPAQPASREALTRAAAAALRLALREFDAAIQACAIARQAPSRFPRLSRQRVWLNPKAECRLTRLIDRLEEFLVQQSKCRRGRPFAVTTVVVPLIKRGRF